MKQYVSRRRRCWILLVQMDPVIHHSEGHRWDMSLDLSGLIREEKLSSSSIHVYERRAKAETIQTLVGFAEKAKAGTLAAENLERVLITRTSLRITIITTLKTWMNPQTLVKPRTTRSILGAMTEKLLRITMVAAEHHRCKE